MNDDNMITKEDKDTTATAIAVAIVGTLNGQQQSQADSLLKYKQNLKKICDAYQAVQILRKDELKGNYQNGLFYQTAWHDHENSVETEIRMMAAFYGSKTVVDFVTYPCGGGWRGSGVICNDFALSEWR